jgi:hypothetical protein
MSDLFDDSVSELLALPAYLDDVDHRRLRLGAGHASWKLERLQYFSDPSDPPWVAYSEGRWDESIRLMEDVRPLVEKECQAAAVHGVTLYRVRIVEEPIVPYIQWELHYLRLATRAGEKIRVVDAEKVRQFEKNGQLPDLLTAGADTVYRILYTAEGVPDAARRIVDSAVTMRCVQFIKDLYAKGEDMDTFFERRIAQLGPPTLERR